MNSRICWGPPWKRFRPLVAVPFAIWQHRFLYISSGVTFVLIRPAVNCYFDSIFVIFLVYLFFDISDLRMVSCENVVLKVEKNKGSD